MPSQRYHSLLFCDLDGTLISRRRPLSSANAAMVSRLDASGVGVVVASGRSPKHLAAVLSADLSLAAAICSTGAGVLDWRTRAFLAKRELTACQAQIAVRRLMRGGCSFMVQDPLPDNHRGRYFTARPEERERPDFLRRLQGSPGDFAELAPMEPPAPAAQLLAVFDREELPLLEEMRESLAGSFSLVRATSPIDRQSLWLEIFAPGVNKASAAQWLKDALAPGAACYALGNDYNDGDLLAWADHARVASTAPQDLQRRHGVLASGPEDTLAEAARLWNLL